jgi:hypothetical protein
MALGRRNGEDQECSLDEEPEMITDGTWGEDLVKSSDSLIEG